MKTFLVFNAISLLIIFYIVSFINKKKNKHESTAIKRLDNDIMKDVPQINKKLSELVHFNPLPEWINVNGGWGYSIDDAAIILNDNEFEGVHNEYVFAEFRSSLEVEIIMKMHFVGFERTEQSLHDYKGKPYDLIKFKVSYLTDEDWNELKNDYDSHNGFENDEEGLSQHEQKRNEAIRYYESGCWIDISHFFGKH